MLMPALKDHRVLNLPKASRPVAFTIPDNLNAYYWPKLDEILQYVVCMQDQDWVLI